MAEHKAELLEELKKRVPKDLTTRDVEFYDFATTLYRDAKRLTKDEAEQLKRHINHMKQDTDTKGDIRVFFYEGLINCYTTITEKAKLRAAEMIYIFIARMLDEGNLESDALKPEWHEFQRTVLTATLDLDHQYVYDEMKVTALMWGILDFDEWDDLFKK